MKQRLLGALVLIALAIIFVPMLFSGPSPKQTSETVNMEIPKPPEREFQTRVLPVDAKSQDPSQIPAIPAGQSETLATVDTKAPPRVDAHPEDDHPTPPTPAVQAPKPPTPDPVVKPTVAKVETPKPVATAPVATPASANGRYFVHLGVYAEAKNANDLVAKLKTGGFPARAEQAEYQGKSVARVRVGPFEDRAAAESARLKIKAVEPKVPGSVVETADAPTGDAPPTAIAANRAGGWAVQLGAFKSADEANKLRDRLRGAGFAAFVDKTGTDAPLWRVRAGPEAERGNADKLRERIKEKLKLDGMIVTQP